MIKICIKCKTEQSFDNFRKWYKSADGLRIWCKKCDNEAEKRCKEKKKEKLLNPDKEEYKTCTICGLEKEFREYGKDKAGRFGLKSKCKECLKQYDKQYNSLNNDKIQQHYILNKERYKYNSKQYYNNNREELIKKQIQYGKDNPHKRKEASKKYSKIHPEYKQQYQVNRYKNDPQFKLRLILSTRLNGALKKNKTYKTNKTLELLGCSIKEFKQYLEHQFKSEMNWGNHGGVWEIDHIQPCSSFNLLNEDEQKQCFHYTNMQPLFKTTEIAKNFGYTDEIGNREKSDRIL